MILNAEDKIRLLKLELMEHIKQSCEDEGLDRHTTEQILKEKEKIIDTNLNYTLGIP